MMLGNIVVLSILLPTARLSGRRKNLLSAERTPFRPLILPANEPRLVVDLDSAGGLSGHAMIGLTIDGGSSKWFHAWSEIDVRYVDGRMQYVLREQPFPV